MRSGFQSDSTLVKKLFTVTGHYILQSIPTCIIIGKPHQNPGK